MDNLNTFFKTINLDEEIILFHGTTVEGVIGIKERGFDPENSCWTCSDDAFTYFYNYKKTCDADDLELDDVYSYNRIIALANQQGQIQNAFQPLPSNITSVIEIRIPKVLAEGYIEPDDSCKNMDVRGVVKIRNANLNKLLKVQSQLSNPDVKIYLHDLEFCVKASLLYLTGIYKNQYAIQGVEELQQYEREALEYLSKEFNEDFYEQFVDCPCVLDSRRIL